MVEQESVLSAADGDIAAPARVKRRWGFGFATIRARLLVSFILTVLLTAGAIAVGSVLTARNDGLELVYNQLESVAVLKETEIARWLDDLWFALDAGLRLTPEGAPTDMRKAQTLLALRTAALGSEAHAAATAQLRDDFFTLLEQERLFEEVFIATHSGEVIFSTDPLRVGTVLSHEEYFRSGLLYRSVTPPTYVLALERYSIILSRPLRDERGAVWGVLLGRVSIAKLRDIMLVRAGLGETGETYLVGANRAMLTDSRFGLTNVYVRSAGAEAVLRERRSGQDTYDNYREMPVVGVYRWLPTLQVALIAELGRSEALGIVDRTVTLNIGIAALAVTVAAVVSLFIARSIGNPVTALVETATQIAGGDINRIAMIVRDDEIGLLARAFNSMTARLRSFIGTLEQQVEARTRELARRSGYLEASAEVGRVASSILNSEQLIVDVVELIRSRLELYYVGLFLVDELGEWAVLRAGTGEAGATMLARQHRLRVGGDSMIGRCVVSGEGRIALDVGAEAIRFDNPVLPETRSEAALPLRSRGRVLGALTIQSTAPAAFDQETITVLQTMADQVAVALDNAVLFAESQENLAVMRRLYGETSAAAWAELARLQGQIGYRSGLQGLVEVRGGLPAEVEALLRAGGTQSATATSTAGGQMPLVVPVQVSGRAIGAIHTSRPVEDGPWTEEELQLLQALADQLGVVLESARLYQETQTRAARERLVGQITAQMRQSLDVTAVLRAVAAELGRLPGVAEASVHVTLPQSSEGAPYAPDGATSAEVHS